MLEKASAGKFPKDLTSITLFAFQISFKGKNCRHRRRRGCDCYSGFCGVVPAAAKEEIAAFGGPSGITEFRNGFMTIDSYDWITRFYTARERVREGLVKPQYLYTLQPLRRVQLLNDAEDDDPIVLIKRRVF